MKLHKKKPKQDRSNHLVDSIIEATAHILEEQNLKKISTNKIAEKAGVSIGSIYQYFLNKESILDSVFNKQIEKNIVFYSQLFEESADKTLEESVSLLVQKSFEYFVNQSGYLRAIHSMQIAFGNSDTIIQFRQKLAHITAVNFSKRFPELGSEELIQEKVFFILCQNFGVIHTYIHVSNPPYSKEHFCKMMIKSNVEFLRSK